MKRILLAASRLMTKSKDTALSPEASATIVQVLKIASTINVPFCQTACNTVIAFIQMREAAGTNDRQWKMLLDVIKIYASRISEFVKAISEGHPPDYFAVSDDLRAKIAREAVQEFETHISQTKAKIDVRLGTGKIKKILAATVVQEEITECRQMIATAHERLNDRILNILAISSTGAPVPPGPSESAPEETEYDIPGARPLRGQDMEILEDVDMVTVVQDSFWTNIVRVEVQNKVRIAKVYDTSDGGKEKFEKDLQFFAKCWSPNFVLIFGYSSRSQFPFVVFTAGKKGLISVGGAWLNSIEASVLPIAEHCTHILAYIVYYSQRPGANRSRVKPFWDHYMNLIR
ncbi:hypothetical protein FRC04_007459 [Tulasnella sp. 424]|nr:hypothetical protein FRC04_007459 [Tulasnella sp. 424]